MSDGIFEVNLKHSAQKEVKSLDAGVRLRVINALRLLAANPRPHGCRKLVGARDRWRIRVGDYRILYKIDDGSRRGDHWRKASQQSLRLRSGAGTLPYA